MLKKTVGLLLALCLLLGGCAGAKNTIPIASVETRTPDQEGIDRSQTIENTPQYLINIQAPVTRSARINNEIDDLIAGEVDAFLKSLPDEVEPEWGSSGLTIEYETHRFNDEIVTFIFEIYAYMAGAAHGSARAVTAAYNLRTGDAYRLSDLFTVNQGDNLAQLSERSAALLKAQLGQDYDAQWIAEGTAPTAENFARFAPLRHGLMILFDPYQVGPWAIGEQRVLIPWNELSGISPVFYAAD